MPAETRHAIYVNCKFEGALPNFYKCEFHDSDLSGCTVAEMIECKLFNTILNGCDWSRAVVHLSLTHPGSPCPADGCRWTGISAVMDCRFWQGLKLSDDAAWLFMAMAMIPESPARAAIYEMLPREQRRRIHHELKKPFRRN